MAVETFAWPQLSGAFNWATDWFKAAKVQQWGAAFRKVQMAALRSGRKDRVDSLKPHQAKFTQLSSEVSIAQLKGMAITWFLVIEGGMSGPSPMARMLAPDQ